MHTEEYDIIMLVKFYSTEMLHRVVSPWSSRGWSKFLTNIHRKCQRSRIHNANTKAVQRDFWIDFDWHFITRSLIYNSVLEGVVLRTALRLKQAREIDPIPGPSSQNRKEEWRRNTCSWSEVRTSTCITENWNPEVKRLIQIRHITSIANVGDPEFP